MHDLVIYGAGGLGREAAEVVRRVNERHRFWKFLGFVDDGEAGGNLGDYALLGGMEFVKGFGRPLDVVVSIAKPSSKRRLYEELKSCPHVHLPNLIDGTAILPSHFTMGEGCIISPFCTLSIDDNIGNCVFLNTGTLIGHDTSLADFCTVMSNVNVSGNVTVGEGTLIGAGASILQGRRIGAHSTVGMGAVVMTDVPEGCTVLGNPARRF